MAIQLINKTKFLLTEKWRFKVLYGGRYGVKSWSVAQCLIYKAMERRRLIVCAREIQNSIKDSVHKLLSDQIERMGFSNYFQITDNEIRCKTNKSTFIFKGLHTNVTDVKSLEGADICWVEEAENVTEKSWDTLIPTIRKQASECCGADIEVIGKDEKGEKLYRCKRCKKDCKNDYAEIWVTFNPSSEDDDTFKRFIVSTPADCKATEVSYEDNPWLTDQQQREIDELRVKDFPKYQHIYKGVPNGVGFKMYPQFKEEIHVRRLSFKYMTEHGNFFMAMDPHKVYYPACLWGCKVPVGNGEFDYVIYNEFPIRTMFGGKPYHEIRHTEICTLTLKQLTGMFQILDTTVFNEQYPINMMGRAVDTRFAKGAGGRDWSSNTGGLVVEWARPENGGLQWTMPATSDIDVQGNNVNKFLQYDDTRPIGPLNDAHLFFMPHCTNIITTMKHHRINEDKGVQDEKYKCMSDTLRILFAIMQKAPYIDPKRNDHEARLVTMKEQLKPLFFTNKVA